MDSNKKSPETFARSRGFSLPWLYQVKLHTTSDPETSGGKIKIPIIGVQQIHAILKKRQLLRKTSQQQLIFVYFLEKSRGKNQKIWPNGIIYQKQAQKGSRNSREGKGEKGRKRRQFQSCSARLLHTMRCRAGERGDDDRKRSRG